MKYHRILIFGGTGSLGKSLIRRFSESHNVAVFSRDEAKHWTIKNELACRPPTFFVGDVRDRARVKQAFDSFRPDAVVAAAALKHVDTCELTPFESVQTNVMGVHNIVEECQEYVTRYTSPAAMMMISTDKACAPVNVYGMCKALSERIVTNKSTETRKDGTKFIGVRYGNVLESRGSIIPLFKRQAMYGNSFTVTHADMTRFVMTLDDSVDLIDAAFDGAQSGEIWVPKLRAMKITDLANIFSSRYNKPVNFIGLRPGEKLHESLICAAESVRVRDRGTHYSLSPAHVDVDKNAKIFDYTSGDDVMSADELFSYLERLGMLEKSLDSFEGKSIEEIRTR